MRLKSCVKVEGLAPEMVLGIMVASSVYANHGYRMVITSITDGTHSYTSLHYIGHAVDLRIREIPSDDLESIVGDMKRSLTNDYDVVLEKDHIHLEYQPKRS